MIEFARLQLSTEADVTSTARRLEVHQIDTHQDALRSGVWVCGGCTARVTARRSYRRGDGTRVLAHFATWPGADGKATHDDGCPFEPRDRAYLEPSTAGSAGPGARTGDGIAAYDARWPNSDRDWVLEEPGAARATSRRSRDQIDERPGPAAPEEAVDDRSSSPGGQDPSSSSPSGAANRAGTLVSARDLLELVRHFGRHPLDLSRFTARWGSGGQARELSWGDLYYPPGRHHLLLTRAVDDDLPAHPVAVAGQIAHLTTRANRRHGGEDTVAYLELPAPLGQHHRLVVRAGPQARDGIARLDLAGPDSNAAARILVVARLSAFTPAGGHPTYCTAWVDRPGQLMVLDDDEAID